MTRVILVVRIDGDTIEEESEIARIIAEGLADRGFPKVELVASDMVYTSPQAEKLSKDTPIVTVSNTLH